MRGLNDGILVGVGTVLADDCQLTCRQAPGRDPLRIVLDSRLRTPPTSKVVTAVRRSKAGTLILTGKDAPKAREKRLVEAGANVVRLPLRGSRVDLKRALQRLVALGCTSLLVEGGPTLAGELWRQRLVDEVALFFAPLVLADPKAKPCWRGVPCFTYLALGESRLNTFSTLESIFWYAVLWCLRSSLELGKYAHGL